VSSEVEVVTIGRLGADTIYPLQTGVGLEDVETFGWFLGASPTNVAVAAARLGHTAAALTGVGDDSFGRFVRREMVRLGVPDAFAITSPDFATLVTFCEILQPDKFPLYFDPQPSAPDMQLSVTDMPLDVIRAAKLFWITVTGLSEEPSRSGHHAALWARDRAPYAVLDLDCRPMFWSSAHEATEQVRKCLGQFTVAVGNREECEVAVGETGNPAGSPTRYSRPASRWPSSSRAAKQRWPRPGTCGSWWPPSRSTSSTGWALVTPPAGPSAIACSMAGHSNASSPGPAQQGDRCLPARVFDGNAHGRRGRGCPGRHARRRSQPRAAQGAEQMTTIDELGGIRAFEPECIAQVLRDRPRGVMPHPDSKLMIIAADHPARSALAAGADPLAMAGRSELLARCVEALSRPCVHGFLGTADMVEDLALLGALDGKAVYGSMNRGSLAGAGFEMGDRFTGYDALGVIPAGWTAHSPVVLDITPEQAGWRFSGSTIVELAAGGSQELATGEDEALALSLRGSCSVEAEGTTYVPAGRPDVFTAVTGYLCLPREMTAAITPAEGGGFAIPTARATRPWRTPAAPPAKSWWGGEAPGVAHLRSNHYAWAMPSTPPSPGQRGADPRWELVLLPAAQARCALRGGA
jgi:sugar/nucleoside kinase (ribokinase family)